jgi:hypothetical protein
MQLVIVQFYPLLAVTHLHSIKFSYSHLWKKVLTTPISKLQLVTLTHLYYIKIFSKEPSLQTLLSLFFP